MHPLFHNRFPAAASGTGPGTMANNAKLFDVVNVYATAAITEINPVAGEDMQVDLQAIGNDVTINFPTPAASAEGKAIGVTLLSDLAAASTVGYAGAVDVLVTSGLQQAGDCELFTWDVDSGSWKLVGSFRRSALLYSVFTTHTPTDATPIDVQPGEFTQIALSSATDNVPVNFVGGFPGQEICIKCTAPAPIVTIPFEFSIQPAGGTELKIRGDTAYFVCTSPGGWEQIGFEAGNPARCYGANFSDADLSGSDLVIPHRLNTAAPGVSIFDNTGALVPPGAGTYSVLANNASSCTVTFDAGLLPLTDTWKYNVVGGSTPDLS